MSEDNYNIIHTQLPSMPAYIATHIDRNVSSSAMVGQKCLICQEDFDPSLDEAFFTASQDDTTCVRVPPCNHLFHLHCITTWLDSTQHARNTCPTCCTPICKLNVLDPIKAATHYFERFGAHDTFYSIANHAAVLSFVDTQLARQGAGDAANYTAIPRAARDFWSDRGNNIINTEHHRCGLRWVEMLAANRVREWILHEEKMVTWPGSMFFGMYTVMNAQFQRMYPIEMRFGLAGTGGADEQEGTEGGSTVVDDELYQQQMMPGGANAENGQRVGADEQDGSGVSTVVDGDLYQGHLMGVEGRDAAVQAQAAASGGTTVADDDLYHERLLDHLDRQRDSALNAFAADPPPAPNSQPVISNLNELRERSDDDFFQPRLLPNNATPPRSFDANRVRGWLEDADIGQDAPASFTAHEQSEIQKTDEQDTTMEDSQRYGANNEDSELNNGETHIDGAALGSTAPSIQWVITPTMPPVRPTVEPIEDYVPYVAPPRVAVRRSESLERWGKR